MSTVVVDVPKLLLAVQLYDPDLPLCMLKIVYEGPLCRTLLGLSVLNHLHVMRVYGFAAVTVLTNVTACPSLTLYTSGLFKKNKTHLKCVNHMHIYELSFQ